MLFKENQDHDSLDILKKIEKEKKKAKNCQDTSRKLEELCILLICKIFVRFPGFLNKKCNLH